MDKTISELDELVSPQATDLLAIVDSNDDTTKKIQLSNLGAGSPAGMDTYVQFNDNGVFGGDAAFSFNKMSLIWSLGVENLAANIKAVDATTADTGGCYLNMNAGVGIGTGAGGGVTLIAGDSEDTVGGEPGNVIIQAGGHGFASGNRGAFIVLSPFHGPYNEYANIQLYPGNDGATKYGVTELLQNVRIGNTVTSSEINSDDHYFFIQNVNNAPAVSPTSGGVLYVQAGALKYRGSSGTVTTLGNA